MTVTAGLLVWCVSFTPSASAFGLNDAPPDADLPDEDPMTDHTAQDDPMREHTAQDGIEPFTPTPPKDKDPRPVGLLPIVDDKRGDDHPAPGDRDDFLQIPILDLLDIEVPGVPTLHDYRNVQANNPITLFNQLDMRPTHNDDFDGFGNSELTGGVLASTRAVPSPGGLILIGLGGLLMHRRRRG